MRNRKERIDEKTLNEIRAALKKILSKLSGNIAAHGKELREPLSRDEVEGVRDTEERGLRDKEDSLEEDEIFLIEEALDRIAKNKYGYCQDCGKEMPIARLKAVPFAQYCVFCKKKRER